MRSLFYFKFILISLLLPVGICSIVGDSRRDVEPSATNMVADKTQVRLRPPHRR